MNEILNSHHFKHSRIDITISPLLAVAALLKTTHRSSFQAQRVTTDNTQHNWNVEAQGKLFSTSKCELKIHSLTLQLV